jgi:hypothetical protein
MRKINLLLLVFTLFAFSCSKKDINPRVIITTDIQVCCGDPDDIQSLCHLLWYANELDIKAIIPDNFGSGEEPGGITAAERVIELYRLDYSDTANKFVQMGFPEPDYLLNNILQREKEASIDLIIKEAMKKDKRPLYILVWGNMNIVKEALLKAPEITEDIRVLSIGTNLRAPIDGGDGAIPNWNGQGRNRIFGDPRFDELWWIENDWGYNGMFSGLSYPEEEEGRPIGGRPIDLMNELEAKGGNLGKHIREVVSFERVKWAHYFRAGDTPSVLYLIDPKNNPDDPSLGSWSGIFEQPFPEERPNYWTNVRGESKYDHADPLNTWRYSEKAIEESYKHLLFKREEMYQSMLDKIVNLYGN